jgi:hypothetical protein
MSAGWPPPGLGWLFRQLELTTGAADWRRWVRRAARADLTSGIPERREPGFWDNVARCCGSAGVAEFFLDLHRLEGQPADLAFAVTLVDDLLGRAISDRSGMRWSNYEFRRPAPDLPPETTYLQGPRASARRCSVCIAISQATRGPCAGPMPRPGHRPLRPDTPAGDCHLPGGMTGVGRRSDQVPPINDRAPAGSITRS